MLDRQEDDLRAFEAYLNRHLHVVAPKADYRWIGNELWLINQPGGAEITAIELLSGSSKILVSSNDLKASIDGFLGFSTDPADWSEVSAELTETGQLSLGIRGGHFLVNPQSLEVSYANPVSLGARLVSSARAATDLKSARTWRRAQLGGYLVDRTDVREMPSPRGHWFASIQNHNVVIRSSKDDQIRPLTLCGVEDRYWDLEAERVSKFDGRPFGSLSSIDPWSPDELFLLAAMRDASNVFKIPRMHWLNDFETVDFVPYQKAGAEIDLIEPHMIDVRHGAATPVSGRVPGATYSQWLGWFPDGQTAFLIEYNRLLTEVRIYAVDRVSATAELLLEESSSGPVKNQLEEVFSGRHGLTILQRERAFLWTSTRDGWRHIYRVSVDDGLTQQLTSGHWTVHEVSHVSHDGTVYFTASRDQSRPYDIQLCSVNLTGGEVVTIVAKRGINHPTFGTSDDSCIIHHSSVDSPFRTSLVSLHSRYEPILLGSTDISALESHGDFAAEEFSVEDADGEHTLWGIIYKPRNFDPLIKYPVIEYIYGGPQSITAPHYFAIGNSGYNNLAWALSGLGYVVVVLDGRGTPGRSRDFQSAINGDWGIVVRDHASAIRQLTERHSWLDPARVGIYGHSWGGYFATRAIIDAPEVYCAAVASEPGYDPSHYILSEPYLGLPQDCPQWYEEADIISRAREVSRPLQIISGTRYNLVTSSVMKMVRSLIESGVDHDFALVPDATHHFVGAEERFLIKKIVKFLSDNV